MSTAPSCLSTDCINQTRENVFEASLSTGIVACRHLKFKQSIGVAACQQLRMFSALSSYISFSLFKRTRSQVPIWIKLLRRDSFNWDSLFKYTIISSFSKSLSHLFLSVVTLYFLLDFSTRPTSFCVRENPVEPWTMLFFANFAWRKAWSHALSLSLQMFHNK